ncbi:MAG: hypothetical protein WC683_06410 [bacterium]
MIDESALADFLAPIIQMRLTKPNLLMNPAPECAVGAWWKNPRDMMWQGWEPTPRLQAMTTLVVVALAATPLTPQRRLLWLRRIRQVGYLTPEAWEIWEAQERLARDAPRLEAEAKARAAADREAARQAKAQAKARAAADREAARQAKARLRAEREAWHAECRAKREAAEQRRQDKAQLRAERAAERAAELEAKRNQRRRAQAERAVLRAVERASRPPRPRLPGRRPDADERALDMHWRAVRRELQLREHYMWKEESGTPPPMISKKWGSLSESELVAEVARARKVLCAAQKMRWEAAMAERPPGAKRVRRPQWMVDEAREAEIEAKNSRGCFVPKPLPRPKQPAPRRNYAYERRERQVDHTRQVLLEWFKNRKKRAWIVGEWKVVLERDIPYATRRAAVVDQLAPMVILIRPPWRRRHERYRCFRLSTALGTASQAC